MKIKCLFILIGMLSLNIDSALAKISYENLHVALITVTYGENGEVSDEQEAIDTCKDQLANEQERLRKLGKIIHNVYECKTDEHPFGPRTQGAIRFY